ncbi:MAG: acetyl-CoA carboxylase biotin carboxyl carrier protein [Victivallales bacterium]|nr:acetyl-CoA carboxylase biotin carboxyl carrier protein [Victivallales bacterium]MBT7166506.1 acetyl-CoA carboxylase biotin carboxyl carrier protein [Victivallales bacterium]
MNTEFSQVEQLAKLMAEYDLTEINIDEESGKLSMCRGSKVEVGAVPQYVAAAAPVATAAAPVEDAVSVADSITAPIVGTFYQSPAPDSPAFVKVGDAVTPETVVCIIEAMKVMNEVKAERSGTIQRLLVEDAHAVEFGQPLFEITPA